MSAGWRMAIAYTLWLASLFAFFALRDSMFVPLVASFTVFMSAMRWATRERAE